MNYSLRLGTWAAGIVIFFAGLSDAMAFPQDALMSELPIGTQFVLKKAILLPGRSDEAEIAVYPLAENAVMTCALRETGHGLEPDSIPEGTKYQLVAVETDNNGLIYHFQPRTAGDEHVEVIWCARAPGNDYQDLTVGELKRALADSFEIRDSQSR